MCPWFPQEGTIDPQCWNRVGDCLNDYYRVSGPQTVPITAFSYFNLIKEILVTHGHSPDVQSLCKEGQEVLKNQSWSPSRAPSAQNLCKEGQEISKNQSRPPSRAPSICPSISINIEEEIKKTPNPSRNSSNNHVDQLNPAEEAELEKEAASYNNLDWPPLSSAPLLKDLPAFRPPPYAPSNLPPAATRILAPILNNPEPPTIHQKPLLQKTSIQEALILIREIKAVAKEFTDLTISTPH